MLLELFPFVILNNGFCICIFFSDFLCFDMSLLLLTVTLRGGGGGGGGARGGVGGI